MPLRQGVLLPLRRGFTIALCPRRLFILVDGHDDTNRIALSALSGSTCDPQSAVACGCLRAFRLQVIPDP